MKHAVGAGITLLIILIFCCSIISIVDHVVDQTIVLVEHACRADEQQYAQQRIVAAESYWKSCVGFFGAVLRHDEIDSVTDSFAQLRAYASREDWDEYYGNCASLLARLEHISSKECLKLQNVM